MEQVLIAVIVIVVLVAKMASGVSKVNSQRPGTSGPNGQRPAAPPGTPARRLGQPQPEVWRQLGSMLERMEPRLPSPQPAAPRDAASDQGFVDSEGTPGIEGNWDEGTGEQASAGEAPTADAPALGAASVSYMTGSAGNPLYTADDMRRAVVMAEILNRPAGRTRRWHPR